MDIQQDNGLSALLLSPEEERVCTGFNFTEGPVWIAADNCLVFSDIHSNRTHRWRPGSDSAEVFREPSNHGNGNTLDLDGNVLTCEHAGRRVAKTAYGGGTETLIDSFEGKLLHSPNDIVVDSSGATWFTDPDYGYNRHPDAVRELDFQGVYRVAPDGSVSVVEDRLEKPNGLTFSPDESLLYIADSSEARKVWRYEVNADGSLGDRTLFADMEHDERVGVPGRDEGGHGRAALEHGRRRRLGAHPRGRAAGRLRDRRARRQPRLRRPGPLDALPDREHLDLPRGDGGHGDRAALAVGDGRGPHPTPLSWGQGAPKPSARLPWGAGPPEGTRAARRSGPRTRPPFHVGAAPPRPPRLRRTRAAFEGGVIGRTVRPQGTSVRLPRP